MPGLNVSVRYAGPIRFCCYKLSQPYRDGVVAFPRSRWRPDMGTDTVFGIPIGNV